MAERLAGHVPAPADDASESVWSQWMNSMEVDDWIQGWLTSGEGARVDKSEVAAVRRSLVAHAEWRQVLGPRYDLLLEAVDLLVRSK